MDNPLVSICCITYNHEPYIRQCLDGFLMQQCSFKYEIIIHDDASTDHTAAIIEEYANRHPDLFIPILQKENQYSKGIKPFITFVFPKARGKYIATCEGDDYWIDPLKLQKQIGFLESNPDYDFSVGQVRLYRQQTKKIIDKKEDVSPFKKDTYFLRDFLKRPFSQLSTFVFKNSNADFPDWFQSVHAGDLSLVVVKVGVKGKIKYHSDIFSIYRLHTNSITRKRNLESYITLLQTLNDWQIHLDGRYATIFNLRRFSTRASIKFIKNRNVIVRLYYFFLIRMTRLIIKYI